MVRERQSASVVPQKDPGVALSTADSLTLVTGGAKSGKSRHAEGLLARFEGNRVYLATAEAWDAEMQARIAAHRAARAGWTTGEVPIELAAALGACDPGAAILIDCATLWLTNLILAERDVEEATDALIAALAARAAPVVVVTNEVGWSIVPDNALARRFRDAQGRLNQRLAGAAGSVVAVIAGLALRLK